MAMATMPERNNHASSRKLLVGALLAVVFVLLGSVFFFASYHSASAADAGDKILVWAGNGAAPGEHSASAPGTLSFMDGTGATTQVMEIPPQTTRVEKCGDGATSPDGNNVALYIGLDAGTLYMMKGTDAPAKVADLNGLACTGGGTFQFSPDSNRFGYISYEADAAQ